MFIPIINCGLQAGETPLIWNDEKFETEQECQEWIDENQDNFTMNELAGGVYPYEV